MSGPAQASRFCALCGRRLPCRMGIEGAGKTQTDRDPVLNFDKVGSTIFGKQGQVLLRPLTDRKQDPVYVWSPIISKCSKTCGNGESTRVSPSTRADSGLMKATSKPHTCAGTLQLWFSCVDHQTRLGVADLYCNASNKPPPQSESCNTSPCPPT